MCWITPTRFMLIMLFSLTQDDVALGCGTVELIKFYGNDWMGRYEHLTLVSTGAMSMLVYHMCYILKGIVVFFFNLEHVIC